MTKNKKRIKKKNKKKELYFFYRMLNFKEFKKKYNKIHVDELVWIYYIYVKEFKKKEENLIRSQL